MFSCVTDKLEVGGCLVVKSCYLTSLLVEPGVEASFVPKNNVNHLQ
nr:MAG TPA: hypothetical protein [Caudoviricetes sp.]